MRITRLIVQAYFPLSLQTSYTSISVRKSKHNVMKRLKSFISTTFVLKLVWSKVESNSKGQKKFKNLLFSHMLCITSKKQPKFTRLKISECILVISCDKPPMTFSHLHRKSSKKRGYREFFIAKDQIIEY